MAESEVVQDFALIAGHVGRERLRGAVDGDGGAAQRAQAFDDLGDGVSAAGLDGMGDGQAGEHDGQVGFDGFA